MTWSYNAGTTIPNLGGLAEFNGVRLNDGSFELHHLGGIIDSAPLRVPVSSLPADSGGFLGPLLYDPLIIALEAKLIVADYTQVGPALDYLRGAFNAAAGQQTLTVNYPGWSAARQVTAAMDGQIVVDEPTDLEKLLPERTFVIPMVAPDPLLYSTTQQVVTIATGGSGTLTTLTNNGTAPTPFVVKFTGPWTNPILVRNSDSASIGFTATPASGHYYQVSTNPATSTGVSAVDDTGANVYGSLVTFTVTTIPPGTSQWWVGGTPTGGAACTMTFRDAWY